MVKHREYNRGYNDGHAGRLCDLSAGTDYFSGWHDGDSDRPIRLVQTEATPDEMRDYLADLDSGD